MTTRKEFVHGVLVGVASNAAWAILLPWVLLGAGAVLGGVGAWFHNLTDLEQGILYTLSAAALGSSLLAAVIRYRSPAHLITTSGAPRTGIEEVSATSRTSSRQIAGAGDITPGELPQAAGKTAVTTALRFIGDIVTLAVRNDSAPAIFTATLVPLNKPANWPPEMRCTWLDATGDSPRIIQNDMRKVLIARLELTGAVGEIAAGKWTIPMHPAPDQVSGGEFRIGDIVHQSARAIDLSFTLLADPPIEQGPINMRIRLFKNNAYELVGEEARQLGYDAVPGASNDSVQPERVSDALGKSDLTEKLLGVLERHSKMLEAQIQPVFRFVPGKDTSNNETFETLEVWNDGEPITSYTVWQGSYIEVTRHDLEPQGTRYYGAYYFLHREYNGDAKTGLLFRYLARGGPFNQSANSTRDFERLRAEVQERYGSKIGIQRRVYLEIYYTDRAGTNHSLTYEIFPTGYYLGPPGPKRCDDMYLGMALTIPLGMLTAEQLVQYWDGGYALPGLAKRPPVNQ